MGRKKINQFPIPNRGSQEEAIASMSKFLELNGIAASFKHVAERMGHKNATFYDFLQNILEKEMNYKEEHRVDRWIQQAHFPFKKTLEEFDFSFQPTIDQRLINDLATCRFIEEGKNIIFLGPPGVGKTHLSIGLGFQAIQQGYEARFLKLDELITRVEQEPEIDSSSRTFKTYARPRLLILDDMDFFNTGKNASTILFKLVCQRHELKASTIFTSNKKFGEWGELFGNKERAGAALDRIIGNAVIINITGESYRVKDKVKKMQIMGAVDSLKSTMVEKQ